MSEMSGLKNQTRSLTQEMHNAWRRMDEEVRQYGRVNEATLQRAQQLQRQITQLTERRAQLANRMAAVESAQQNVNTQQGRLGAVAGAATVAAAPLVGAVTVAANFEQAMSKVQAITNASNEDMKRLNATAQELGAKTQFSASQAAEAMSYLGMAGWKTEQIISGMPGLLDLAAASGSDLATVADIVSDDLTAFGMSADQAGHMADVMAAASTNANTNVEMMGQTFKYAGAVAGALGYDLEDVAIATGLMANAGIKADQAGTSLRSIMTRLAAPTKESGTAMDMLGISVTNADGTMKPFMQTMEDLRDAFSGLSEAEKAEYAKSLAGQEAMSGFLAIVNASDEDFAKLSNEITNCDGAAARMASIMNNNAKGAITQLMSAVEGAAIALGQVFLPPLTAIIKKISEVVSSFTAWAKEHQELVAGLGAVAAAVAGAAVSFYAFKTAQAYIELFGAKFALFCETTIGYVPTLSGAFRTLGQHIFQVFTMIGRAPMAMVNGIKAIPGLISGAGSAIMGVVTGMMSSIGTAITGAITFIRTLFAGGLVNGIRGAFIVIRTIMATNPIGLALLALSAVVGIVIANWESFKETAGVVWGYISNIISGTVQRISDTFGRVVDTITNVWNKVTGQSSSSSELIAAVFNNLGFAVEVIFAGLAATIETSINIIANIIETLAKVIGGLITFVTGVFSGDWEKAWNGLSDIVGGVLDGIRGTIEAFVGGASQMLSNLLGFGGVKPESPESPETPEAGDGKAVTVDAQPGTGWEAVKVEASNTYQWLVNEAANTAQWASNGLSGMWNGLTETASNTMTWLGNIIQQGVSSCITFIQNLPMNIIMGFGIIIGYLSTVPGRIAAAWASFTAWVNALPGQIQTAGTQFVSNAAEWLSQTYATVSQWLSQTVTATITFLQQLPTQLQQMATQFIADVIAWMSQTYNTAVSWMTQLVASVSAFLQQLPAACAEAGAAFVNAAISWAQSAYDGVMNWINQLPGAISSVISNAWENIKSTFSAGFSIGVNAAPHAKGGIFNQPHLGLVAEAGPEAIIPLDGSKNGMRLWQQAGAMMGAIPQGVPIQQAVNVTAGETPNISIPQTQTALPDIPQPVVNVASSPAMTMPDIPQPMVNVAASKMPEITMPQVEIPSIPQPVVNVAASEMPSISIPQARMVLPDMPQPVVNVAAGKMPEIAMPQAEMPDIPQTVVNVPASEMPNISIPQAQMVLPDIQQTVLPDIPQPVVNVVAGKMPEIAIPQAEIPSIPQPMVNVTSNPAMAMPDIPQPMVNVAASKMPEITMPQVEIPSIPQPVVNVAASEMPNISIPQAQAAMPDIPQPMVNVMASQPEIAQAVPATTVDEPVQPIEAPHSYDNSHTDFTFAPQITINGNADEGTIGQLKAALAKAEREMEAKFDRLMREREARMRRLSYS
jgi:TP901 family phage tail tape measure protein